MKTPLAEDSIRATYRPAVRCLPATVLVVLLVFCLGLPRSRGQVTIEPPSPSRLLNLSVRANLNAGEKMIVGFILAGTSPNRMLIRAAGPGLASFGVTNPMPNPKLQLMAPGGNAVIATNDDWSFVSVDEAVSNPSATSLFQAVSAFAFAPGSSDAALSRSLAPAGYTVLISGSSNADSGVVLAELYDTRQTTDSSAARLTNLSVRAKLDPEAGLIVGFVVTGVLGERVLVRAVGPTLNFFGVAGAVADPKVDVMNARGEVIASNDNWSAGGLATTVQNYEAMRQANTFIPLEGSKDAACVVYLPPGVYTARASGVGGTLGETLLEVYELPP